MASAEAMARGGAEVDWRNAGSRAYYAAFHGCRVLAQGIEPHTDTATGSAHRMVADILTKPTNETMHKRLGYKLRQCGIERRRADYDIDDDFPRESCLAVVETCQEIVGAVGAGEGAASR